MGCRRALAPKAVAQASQAGDPLAAWLVARSGHSLGVGLGNAINLINPSRILLGGGVTKSGPDWWTAVRQSARATALPEFEFEVMAAALADDAPLWGAVALAADLLTS